VDRFAVIVRQRSKPVIPDHPIEHVAMHVVDVERRVDLPHHGL
jgi:hypothetical protein